MSKERLFKCPMAVLLCLFLVLTVPGCAPQFPSPALHEQLLHERLALRPDPAELPVSLSLFARSKPEGVVKGMGAGMAEMLGSMNGGSCSGEMCGVVLLAMLGIAVVVGGSVGAVQGFRAATSKQRAAAIETFTAERLGDIAFGRQLAERVLEVSCQKTRQDLEEVSPPPAARQEPDAAELRDLERRGFAKLVALHLKKLEFAGDKGEDPRLGLTVEVLAVIADTSRGERLFQRAFRYRGTVHRYSEWLTQDVESLVRERNAALEGLATEIVATLFIAPE